MIKQVFRKLASANHPDKGGSTESMQLINCAYKELCKFFAMNETLDVNEEGNEESETGEPAASFDFSFLDELKAMAGVVIEICGYWVWLSGDTYPHRELIKNLGFKFSGSKKSWYWSPTIATSKFMRGTKPMAAIRKKYGSEIIKNAQRPTLN